MVLKSKPHQILIILLVLVFVRLLFVFLPSMHADVIVYQSWTNALIKNGFENFYKITNSDYFPGYLYILNIIGTAYDKITNQSFNSRNFELLLKSFNSLFDLGTAFFIYLILNRFKSKYALLGGLLYLYNPITILNSLVWGQSDGVVVFFLVSSIYFLIISKRYFLWSLFFAFAFLVKPQSIIAFPLLLLFHLNRNFLKFSFFSIISLIMILILAFPFFPSNPILGLIELFKKSTSLYPFTSIYADNFWQLFGWFKSDQTIFWQFSLQKWGYLLFFIAYLLICIPLLTKQKEISRLFLLIGLAFAAFFLFPTRIHERYLFPALPFLQMAAFLIFSKRAIVCYSILSLVHFANVWFVYFYLINTNSANELGKTIPFILLKSKLPTVLTIIVFLILLVSSYTTKNLPLQKIETKKH